jgi:hypothetical protein
LKNVLSAGKTGPNPMKMRSPPLADEHGERDFSAGRPQPLFDTLIGHTNDNPAGEAIGRVRLA